MNYAQLLQAVQDYTENTEPLFVSDIPTFVRQAEQRIYNQIQFPSLRKNVVGNSTAGNRYLSCPTDFLAPYSMALIDGTGAYQYLLNKDVSYIREAFPNPATAAAPQYYALFGPRSDGTTALSFILGPTPDSNYQIELHYFYYPESIVTASTSWLGDNFDSVLLYATLVEAYTFMKGEQDMMALYDKKYTDAIALAKRLGDGLERRDAYRSGQTRVPIP